MINYEKNYKKLINFWVGSELNRNHIIKAKKNIIDFFSSKKSKLN